MEKLKIEATEVSPEIVLDLLNNDFSIKGKSIVTEVDAFYAPVFSWLENAETGINSKVDFVFDLEYFNIYSSKRILFILYKLAEFKKSGLDINIIWHFSFEDDDMKEVGEDFACMVNIPFEFISNTLQKEYL